MHNTLQTRLKELQLEYQKGQERLSELEQETTSIKTSMLRISGAIQVLEEILKNETIQEKENLDEKVKLTPNGVTK